MKTLVKTILSIIGIFFAVLAMINPAFAATNNVTDPGGGGVFLSGSGDVTVTSTPLQMVKQVWIGGTCYASSPADANCSASSTSINVPAGTTVDFLIYVDNTIPFVATDARISDTIQDDAAGFTYVAGSMYWNNMSTVSGSAIATIFGDATASLSDGTADDIVEARDTDASTEVDQIDVGKVLAANTQLNITASRVFALKFQAIKK